MTFGRKQTAPGRARTPQAAPIEARLRGSEQTFARAPSADDGWLSKLESMSMPKLALLLVGVLLGLATIEAFAAGTSLITPLPEGVAYYSTVAGAILGLLSAIYMWLTDREKWRTVVQIGSLLLAMPLFVGGWANVMAWRVAEHIEFGMSDAGWERAVYPVEYFGLPSRRALGFSRYTAEIDPFDVGGNTDIPIPEAQFDAYSLRSGKLCIAVQQRRSPSGAIQVRTDGSLTLNEPAPVEFLNCPAGPIRQ